MHMKHDTRFLLPRSSQSSPGHPDTNAHEAANDKDVGPTFRGGREGSWLTPGGGLMHELELE